MDRDAINKIVDDRADWLVDAVAGSTQNTAVLRGHAKEDEVLTEAIYLNAQKAIRAAIDRALSVSGQ